MNWKTMIQIIDVLWDNWDLRGLMLMSLSLQCLLLFFAHRRKRTPSDWVIGTIFCLYLLADWAANFTSGMISSSISSLIENHKIHQQRMPLALWSAFLMVHLGGPATITAFTLQDNDFWHRHALALVFQCVSATYIFIQTLAQNEQRRATVLVFVYGFIKYYERTRCLYKASLDNLRDAMRVNPNPGPSYTKITGVHAAMKNAGLPTRFETTDFPPKAAGVDELQLNHRGLEYCAFRLFRIAQNLFVDLRFSNYQRNRSRNFFLLRSPAEAFKIIAIELNYIYDILFTKAMIPSFLLVLFSSILIVTACSLYYSEEKKYGLNDVVITYALFAGTFLTDVGAWITLFNGYVKINQEPVLLLPPGSERQKKKLVVHEWSNCVCAYNVIDHCLDLPTPKARKIMDWIGARSYIEGMWYVRRKKFSDELRDHIFKEMKERSELAEGSKFFKEAISARGSFTLRCMSGVEDLLRYTDGMDYDRSLLVWHIATDICWNKPATEIKTLPDSESNDKKNSKLLSEYMLYLVVMQPEIMYGVTDIGQTRLIDTRAEILVVGSLEKEDPVDMFPGQQFIAAIWKKISDKNPEDELSTRRKKFMNRIRELDSEMDPVCVKGHRSKSVFFEGCRLAKRLDLLEDRKWEIMSKVWVEVLTYAAVRCRPKPLAERLSKGGELICFVRLLMAHFGLMDQDDDDDRYTRTHFFVDK